MKPLKKYRVHCPYVAEDVFEIEATSKTEAKRLTQYPNIPTARKHRILRRRKPIVERIQE